MGDKYVSIERNADIAVVRFDRGRNLNAFNAQLIQELTEVAHSFHGDFDTRAVVLTGSNAYFSAGADIQDMSARNAANVSDAERRDSFARGGRLCDAWQAMPQVTIAAIEKLAVGAGVALAIALDWRVIGRSAYLYVPEVKIGLNLQWGALPRLISLVGPARAKRICILCEKMPSATALEWGLVEEIADDGTTLERALDLAKIAASMPPVAVQIVKEAVNATAGALHKAVSYADFDQSQLTAALDDAVNARGNFSRNK